MDLPSKKQKFIARSEAKATTARFAENAVFAGGENTELHLQADQAH
jgi:hypothetical protein